LWVDSLNNGTWALRASTAGTQQNINDIYYVNYASVANWRVETVWGISCDPTFRQGNSTMSAVVKSKSNITNNRSQSTGIKNNVLNGVSVYPNPTSGSITINFADVTAGKTYVKVISVLGQEVYNTVLNNVSSRYTIDLNSAESGTYIVQVITSKGVSTQRIVKH